VEFDVLTAMKIKITAFGNITTCSLIDKCLHFAGIYSLYIAFEVLTAVIMKTRVILDIMPCIPLKINRRFGGTCCYLLHSGFLLGLFIDPEDLGVIFLRNFG
jgi:hypothetical protein